MMLVYYQEVANSKIDEVFIGSCMTNIGHFRAAGKLLDQHKGQLPTRLWVAPPTKMDAAQLTEEGYYSVFGKEWRSYREVPGCSLCMGNQARVADGATVVSTSTRNFPNRLGTRGECLPCIRRACGSGFTVRTSTRATRVS